MVVTHLSRPAKPRKRRVSAVTFLVLVTAASVSLLSLAIALGHKSLASLQLPPHLGAIPSAASLFDTISPESDSNRIKPGFAGCLLVKDVNHWLPEWIAYHHLFLPLTELIVAVDPHSIQSPRPILERFNTTLPSLHIDMWYDDDYISPKQLKNIPNYPPKGAPSDLWADMIRERYLFRQNWFLSKCLSEIQKRNRTEWVLLHDADEFVVFNRHGSKVWKKELMPQYGEGTLLGYISATQGDEASPFHKPETCIPMPRLLFGSMESSSEQVHANVPTGFDARNFATLRYRHHVDQNDVRASGFVKPLINVGRSPTTGGFHVEPARDPHCPYPKPGICSSFNIMQHINSDWSVHESPLVMNHYVGSWESFAFGRKWFLERFNETKGVTGGVSDEIRPWLAAFVNTVGNDKARHLLQGSGDVNHDYGELNDLRLGKPYEISNVPLEKVLAEVKAKKEAAAKRSVKLITKGNIGMGGFKKLLLRVNK